MKYYPIFLDLKGRRVLVFGGGKVAERKIRTLLSSGAAIILISPTTTPQIRRWAQQGRIQLKRRSYRSSDIQRASLVIATTDNPLTQKSISSHAHKQRIPINVVDRPELCSFITPATINRGSLTIAISTSGKSPALAQRLRKELSKEIGSAYGELLGLLGSVRKQILIEVPSLTKRRLLFHKLVQSDILDLLKKKKRNEAKKRLASLLKKNHVGLKLDLS